MTSCSAVELESCFSKADLAWDWQGIDLLVDVCFCIISAAPPAFPLLNCIYLTQPMRCFFLPRFLSSPSCWWGVSKHLGRGLAASQNQTQYKTIVLYDNMTTAMKSGVAPKMSCMVMNTSITIKLPYSFLTLLVGCLK